MPLPEYVMLICVWFIGVWLVVLIRSCWIGFGDNSIPDGAEEGVVVLVDDDVVAVVLLVVVEVAAIGVVTIVNATTIIASMKIVAAMMLLSFLLLRRYTLSHSQARIQTIKELPERVCRS